MLWEHIPHVYFRQEHLNMPATEIAVHGAITSAVYAMLAVGFTLMFGVARLLNLAHGTFYMLGAYFTYTFAVLLQWPLLLAAVLAVLLTAGVGWLMERWILRPQRGTMIAVLMVSLAFALVFEQLVFVIFGSEVINVPSFIDAKFSIGNADVSGQQALTLVVAVVVLAALWALIQYTRAGAAILALSQDVQAAQYMGIPVKQLNGLVWALSAAVAAAAGLLLAPITFVHSGMGFIGLKAFPAAVVGGFGSLPGAVAGGLIIGLVEAFAGFYLPEGFKDVAAYVVVLIMLVLKPNGLFGGSVGKKV